MSFQTLEVELEDGRVRPSGGESLLGAEQIGQQRPTAARQPQALGLAGHLRRHHHGHDRHLFRDEVVLAGNTIEIQRKSKEDKTHRA